MTMPALKVNEYIQKLNECRLNKQPLGDIDRFDIENHIRSTMPDHPEWAMMLRSVLAHTDGKIDEAKTDMESAAIIAPHSLTIRNNMAILLAEAGYEELAIHEVRQVLYLSCKQNSFEYLDGMAQLAISLGDMDSISEIIRIANKIQLCTPMLTQAALLLHVEGESDEDIASILDQSISYDDLRMCSMEISDVHWQEMKKFADELAPFVN